MGIFHTSSYVKLPGVNGKLVGYIDIVGISLLDFAYHGLVIHILGYMVFKTSDPKKPSANGNRGAIHHSLDERPRNGGNFNLWEFQDPIDCRYLPYIRPI